MIRNITIRGARQHNLKNIDLEIPRDCFTVITGLSGSGKSSLAFDTIYAEGQRRYIESLSTYARQYLEQMEKPDVDLIEGLSPAISIEQKSTSRSTRSTVGTITEIYDYLRLLFSSIGVPHCPRCSRRISRQSLEQIVETILVMPHNERIMVLAPVVRERKGEFKKQLERYLREGYLKARIDGAIVNLDKPVALDKRRNHTIEIIVDRLLVTSEVRKRLEQSVQTALLLADGLATISVVDGEQIVFSERLACVHCGINVPVLEPRSFSFNSGFGACPVCEGTGSQLVIHFENLILNEAAPVADLQFAIADRDTSYYLREGLRALMRSYKIRLNTPFSKLPSEVRNAFLNGTSRKLTFRYGDFEYGVDFAGALRWLEERYFNPASDKQAEEMEKLFTQGDCKSCGGTRLKAESLSVRVGGRSISDYASFPLGECLQAICAIVLTPREEKIAGVLLKEIRDRVQFLLNVGLGYLTLHRTASTLSAGEAQRVRLATQIGSQLKGVLYVLDEPSIGLHPRDNERLISTLLQLRDLGNTILVVEHDEETIKHADHIIDLGPGAGSSGGHIVASGDLQAILQAPESLTGQYLSGARSIDVPAVRRASNGKSIVIHNAAHHNLKHVDVTFPLGLFIAVTGVSGAGKSSLVDDVLYRSLARPLYRSIQAVGAVEKVEGIEHIDKVIEIDQSPIGRTPRSNPATYTGLFAPIRELYTSLPEAKLRGYRAGRFSFNVKGGRCEHCQGDGLKRIEMNFLPDVYVTCEACNGARYNRETLTIKYKGYSIADLLNQSIQDAYPILENFPTVRCKLQTLIDVGLGYIKLGQSATTLSGGEAQRVKLARELSRKATGKTLYILDEPTTGLHFDDVKKLLDILHSLVRLGNTVVVIEHNLEVIKTADWLIDLGPEGGKDGGRVVAMGTPEEVARVKKSYTGQALKKVLRS